MCRDTDKSTDQIAGVVDKLLASGRQDFNFTRKAIFQI